MSSRGMRTTEFEDRDYYAAPRRSVPDLDERRRTVTIAEPREGHREDRLPSFLREDSRRTEAGPMVLRTREVETVDRHRPRSPSPVRIREERLVRRARSISPPTVHEHERSRSRVVERERERVREPSRKRSPSPRVVRYVERPKRSPSPVVDQERERIRTRIIERERAVSPPPAPKPSPPPQVIKGPTIEREVVTHYRDIDHGVVRARPHTPPPPPRPASRIRERETDIDISLSKNKTEVDISRTVTRSKSHERRSGFHDDEMGRSRETERVRFEEPPTRRRAHSAAPTPNAVDEEGDYLTSKIDSRGKMGEAWGGATKDWAIIDVPPGTERVRMDGVGGGAVDTSWTRYSGVRRTKFVPERDGAPSPIAREPSPPPTRERDRTSVTVFDREREVDVERVTERRPSRTSPRQDMWTEITKDLVVREAIEELGYDYEETKEFFYVMDYLRYDDVLHLVDISDEIRRARRHRARELEYEREREYQEEWERHRHMHAGSRWDEFIERERERDFHYDSRPPRGYIRN